VTRVEASGLVKALERVWSAVQWRHPDVPAVVVTLGAGSVGVPSGVLKLGHFAANRWTPGGADSSSIAELFVGGEGLVQGAESVLATLLHEAAHGVADVRHIQDTSRQGRYHNTRYRTLAQELGLTVRQVAGIGWSDTALADGTAASYAAELAQLTSAITAYRYAEGALPSSGDGRSGGKGGNGGSAGGGKGSPKNGIVLICACPRRIRVSTAAAALGPILCGICDTEFSPQTP
jgi:hypothetical protein